MLSKLWEFANEFGIKIRDDHVSAFAAQGAFFLLLSLFPFLILLLTMTKLLPISQEELIQFCVSFTPVNVHDYVYAISEELYSKTGSTLISFSVVATLWSASRGILSITKGLNTVYRTNENRNYFVLRTIATIQTLILAIGIVVMLIVFVFGNSIYHSILADIPFINDVALLVISIRVVAGFVIFLIMFLGMYKLLPNHTTTISKEFPGAAFTSVLWIAASYIFSAYVENYNNFSYMYGSLAGIAVAMLWLYALMNILLIGGCINKVFDELGIEMQSKKKRKREIKKMIRWMRQLDSVDGGDTLVNKILK